MWSDDKYNLGKGTFRKTEFLTSTLDSSYPTKWLFSPEKIPDVYNCYMLMVGRKNYVSTRVVPSYISAAETAGGLFNFLKLVGTILNLYIFCPKERLNILYNYLNFRHGVNTDNRSVFYDYFSLQFSRVCGDTDVSREISAMNNEFYNSYISLDAMIGKSNPE